MTDATRATSDECARCHVTYIGFMWWIVKGRQYCKRCMERGVTVSVTFVTMATEAK